MKKILPLLILAPALLVAAACAAPAPTPAAEKPAAAKPAEAKPAAEARIVADKPAVKAEEKPAVKEAGPFKLAEKPGTAPFVAPAMNASNMFNPANTLILYGDMALFAGRDNPENCVLRSRYKRGEPVGFRMSAVDPESGKFAETAELVVKIAYNGKTESVPMRYRGAGDNPRPGFWTAKWVVPDDAPLGVIKYTVEAKDTEGKTAIWAPFNIEASMLTIVP